MDASIGVFVQPGRKSSQRLSNQGGQADPADVDVGDEDVAGDLSDVLEEGEVEVLVVEPRQLQVAVHVGAVGVAVAEVGVVVLAVVDRAQPAVCADANWKRRRKRVGMN